MEMGFLLGGSTTFSRHPLYHHGQSTPSSSNSSYVLLYAPKLARKKTIVTAHGNKENPKRETSLQRRAVLLLAVAASPLLQKFGVSAVEATVTGEPVVFRHGERERRLVRGKQRADIGGGLVDSMRNEETRPAQAAMQAPQLDDRTSRTSDNTPQILEGSLQELDGGSPKVVDINNVSSLETNQDKKAIQLDESQGNKLLPLLNAAGIYGSGVLAALYATSRKEKASMEATIDSLKSMSDNKDASIASLKKNFEKRMSNEQDEHKKQIRRLKEEEQALSNKLASANLTITSLGKELQSEKSLIEDLSGQLDKMRNSLLQANNEKKDLEGKIKDKTNNINFLQDRVTLLGYEIKDKEKYMKALNTTICEKELECKNLSSSFELSKSDNKKASSAVQQLTADILRTKEEMESKKHLINDLTEKLQLLSAEKEESAKKLSALQKDYEDFKTRSAKKADLDAELSSKKTDELRQLEQELEDSLHEAKVMRSSISSLSKENENYKAMHEEEMNKVKKLQNELYSSQQSLKASKLEESNLSSRLEESETKFKQLEADYSKIQEDFSEAKSLNSNLDETKSANILLSDELASLRDVLDGTEQELFMKSSELKKALEAHESLQKELSDVSQKAETAAHDLKEERNTVEVLKRELNASRKETIRESETIKTLEKEISETKNSLAAMSDRTITLSRELEDANSRASGLEEEKRLIHNTLMEQRNIAKEAQENIEDAQNLIARLGTERESLQRRIRKLEGDLAAAKGEILRLRRQSNSSKQFVDAHDNNANGVEATNPNPVIMRKSDLRRKKRGNTE